MIFGLVGLFGGWCMLGIPCFIAVVLGHMATRKTKRGARSGHGMAVAGLMLGYIIIIPAVAISLIFLLYPAQAASVINSIFSIFDGS
ncbi:DUF4190 domain-containing protein [Streptosporangium sp. KLBMP 9127]|nr:DUF4190 domain-containing protein [Streptosporangium sp. KLBMP 9127]